jgi:citrate lyase beta subunit
MSSLALKSFNEYMPNHNVLSDLLSINDFNLAEIIYKKVYEKLKNEAVEDFRIDFEDGFGHRTQEEEDKTAMFTAEQLALAMEQKILSPFIGIRIKSITEELKNRSIRTLNIFLSTLLEKTNNKLPENFVITLPKVTNIEQVLILDKALEIIEEKRNIEKNILKIEIMIESTESVFDQNGNSKLIKLVNASKERCRGVHFGAYDYTASCDITSTYQTMKHPACDFIRNIIKVSLANTNIWLSDGATNIMPIGKYRYKSIEELSNEQLQENTNIVHNAWKLHSENIKHAFVNGYYQGWDLHPAQIPIRYATCYLFFLQGLNEASKRLKNFIEKTAQATLVGDIFDDAATGQGLLNYFLRALSCGAINESELIETGLSIDEIQTRSFFKILKMRNIF